MAGTGSDPSMAHPLSAMPRHFFFARTGLSSFTVPSTRNDVAMKEPHECDRDASAEGEQPTGSDPPATPELFEGLLDGQQVAALFADLREHADIRRVQVRSAAPAGIGVSDRTVPLAEARRLLQEGSVAAVQIYYDFDGKVWCDTLFPTRDSVRLLRAVVPPARFGD